MAVVSHRPLLLFPSRRRRRRQRREVLLQAVEAPSLDHFVVQAARHFLAHHLSRDHAAPVASQAIHEALPRRRQARRVPLATLLQANESTESVSQLVS